MRRRAIQIIIALSLVAFGWIGGRAKAPASDFTLEIEGPSDGPTVVKCVRGCTLQGGRDEGNPQAGRMLEYQVSCSGRQRCSGTANGWIKH